VGEGGEQPDDGYLHKVFILRVGERGSWCAAAAGAGGICAGDGDDGQSAPTGLTSGFCDDIGCAGTGPVEDCRRSVPRE
jgi:hypothetical protein